MSPDIRLPSPSAAGSCRWPTSASPANVEDISGSAATNMTVGTGVLRSRAADGRTDRRLRRSEYSAGRHGLSPAHRIATVPTLQPGRRDQPPPDRRPAGSGRFPSRTRRSGPSPAAAGLAKDPNQRFTRCADFARALAEQITAAAPRSSATPTTPAPAARKTAVAADEVASAPARPVRADQHPNGGCSLQPCWPSS